MEMINGSYAEQLGSLWSYMEKVRRTNPGTTILMKVEDGTKEQGEPRFEKLYVCLQACKEGFKSGRRKLIRVDGCHMRACYCQL